MAQLTWQQSEVSTSPAAGQLCTEQCPSAPSSWGRAVSQPALNSSLNMEQGVLFLRGAGLVLASRFTLHRSGHRGLAETTHFL
jgi:hypothetical protein